MFISLIKLLINIIYPKYCTGCNKLSSYFCDECKANLDFITMPLTPKLEPLYIDKIKSCCHYQHPVNSLIKIYKYQGVKEISRIISQIMYDHCAAPDADIITFVPLSRKRLKQRGFNQAAEIAFYYSFLRKISCYPLLIANEKKSTHQAETFSRKQRLKNLQTVFEINPNINLKIFNKKNILIIDDVVTTGITLNECSKVLKQYGAKNVYGLTMSAKVF